ncbi:MAG: SDR family oxidoreductase [Gemmatimonadetes bacterium]|nr:SDR family oxidoreductase [Gemmatimonadota bacterium]
MGQELVGKVAIVTGAGSVGEGVGNGKAAAILFAREGAAVFGVDHNLAAAVETQRLIEAEGGRCAVHQADVSVATECQGIVDACVQRFGRLDILHNNVGIELAGGLLETTEAAWDRTLAVNLKSMFLLCRAAIPVMEVQGGGVVINVSSINSIRTLPALSLAYAASKAGVNALTRELAVEYAKRGIRVNAILPGMMNTPFVRAALTEAYGGDIQEMTRFRDARCPTGKQGESWDIGHLAVFLASDRAKYITGAELVVDGGQTLRI